MLFIFISATDSYDVHVCGHILFTFTVCKCEKKYNDFFNKTSIPQPYCCFNTNVLIYQIYNRMNGFVLFRVSHVNTEGFI